MTNKTRTLSTKEILADCLTMERHLTETYNKAANDSTGDNFRSDMMGILQEEHQLQSAVFHWMNRRGYHKVQQADQQEIAGTLKRVDKEGL
ncbi:MAG: spore coat protein [Peptococcaceae bacterium]|nr:spore coat protein [Peptococcaceae bacterium]